MPKYVIQKHDASNLHYDLRMEFDGVLKSWAVPKKPPKKPGVKRLAIKVEDHSIEYGEFEGEIKEGYGKGTVEIWDKGEFELIDRKEEKIVVEIKGEKLQGKYTVLKTDYEGGDKWLFFKNK